MIETNRNEQGLLLDISPNSLLNSKRGTYRVDKLPTNAFLQGNDGKNQKIIKRDISPDAVDAYELELKNGNIITLGGNCLVQTTVGVKKISELEEDDYVLHKLNGPISNIGNKEITWENKLTGNSNPIKVPTNMDENFAMWLGILCAKGKILKSGLVAVNSRNPKILTLFTQLTNKIFQFLPDMAKDPHTGMPMAYFVSKNISSFLFDFIGRINKMRKVPKQIAEGSSSEQIAFLRGLSLDGYVEDDRLYLYGGVSKKIADFIANTLRNIGYHVTLKRKLSGSGVMCYYVKLVGKGENSQPFSPLEAHKQVEVPLYNFVTMVSNEFYDTKVKTSHKNYSAIRNIRQRKPKTCLAFIPFNLGIPFNKEEYYVQVKACTKKTDTMLFRLQVMKPTGVVSDGLVILSHK